MFLLQRQRTGNAQAQAELRTFAQGLKGSGWPVPLVRLYLGEESAGDAIAAASRPEEQCEAHYYLGRLRIPDDAALAGKELQKAMGPGCEQSEFAEEELRALQSR